MEFSFVTVFYTSQIIPKCTSAKIRKSGMGDSASDFDGIGATQGWMGFLLDCRIRRVLDWWPDATRVLLENAAVWRMWTRILENVGVREIMKGDNIDRIKIEAKKSDVVPVYMRRWDTYVWAWVEYNRKDQVWMYGGLQENKDKVDENREGQERIEEMFTNNQINVKKDGRQSWDDSGRDNKDSEAGIWMVETLRRRQKIGLTKRGKVNIKKVRREMLAGYIWREESFRVEMEKEERGKRMKKTKTKEAETDEEDKEESEEMEATQATWEAKHTTKRTEDTTLREMGFNEKAESSSRGGRIRRREQYQQSQETYEYPQERHSKTPKTGQGKDRAETEREVRVERKRKKTEFRTKLENQVQEWSQQEPEGEEMTENAREVLNKIGKATTDLIRKVIRDGMQTERMDITEETYKHNEYIILDVSWSQFSESNTDRTKTIFRGKEANSGFQRVIGSQEKTVVMIHYAHHWSFTVINTKERKLQTYDSMIKAGHKKANVQLQDSIEEILGEEQQHKWKLEQVQVPQQNERESCGYRMMYNLDKICSGEDIEPIENEDFALEGYILEIIKMLKRKQQNKANRKKPEEEKSIEEEEGREKRRKENLEEEEESMRKESEQELQKREEEMDEKIAERTRKRKE